MPPKYLLFSSAIFLSLFCFFLGAWFSKIEVIEDSSMNICPLQSINKEKLAVIELSEVSPFGIKGKINGNNVRLFNGDNILEIKPNDNFQINTAKIFRNIAAVIPVDAMFFASAKGKKFYPISNTKQMETIRPENLVFFTNELEAINKGLTLSK